MIQDTEKQSPIAIQSNPKTHALTQAFQLVLAVIGVVLLGVIAFNLHVLACGGHSNMPSRNPGIVDLDGDAKVEPDLEAMMQSMGIDSKNSKASKLAELVNFDEIALDSPEHLFAFPQLVDFDILASELKFQEGMLPLWTFPGDSGSSGIFMEIPVENLNTPFLVSAIYSKADSAYSLYHFQAEQTEQHVFTFHVSKDGLGVDVVAPDYTIRVTDPQMQNAEKNGADDGFLVTLPPVALRTSFNNETGTIKVESIVLDAWAFFVQYGGFVFPSSTVSEYFGQWPQVLEAKAFPHNIIVEVRYPVFGVQFSLSRLPEVPMTPRVADDRVGYFSVSYTDLGIHETPQGTNIDPTVTLISKWRLERQEGSKQVIKPILYHIDPSVPEQWRPHIKKGVEKWNLAFDKAGYENAVKAVSPGEEGFSDEYDAGDIRFNAISWAVSMDSVFAVGFSTNDPRTGEILKANIIVTHGWIQSWASRVESFDTSSNGLYDISSEGYLHHAKQASQFNDQQMRASGSESIHLRDCQHKRAGHHFMDAELLRSVASSQGESTLPVDVIGEGLTDVIMHEVGHTLGLRHNFKASTELSWDQLKDQKLTQEKGLTASVMDYLPVHFRSDTKEKVDLFSTTLGKYDYWAIKYGYIPLSDEKAGIQHPTLKEIASRVNEKGLVFATDEDDPSTNGEDPYNNLFDLSSNPLDFAKDRIQLVKITRESLEKNVKDGESWVRLASSEIALLGQIYRSMGIAVKFLGGYDISKAHKGDKNSPSSAISLITQERQKEAMDLICDILSDDELFFSPEVFMRLVDRQGFECKGLFSACNGLRSVDALQMRMLVRINLIEMLLDESRLMRMQHIAWVSRSRGIEHMQMSDIFGNITSCTWGNERDIPLQEDRWGLAGWWVDRLMVLMQDLTSPITIAARGELLALLKQIEGNTEMSTFTDGMRHKLSVFASAGIYHSPNLAHPAPSE